MTKGQQDHKFLTGLEQLNSSQREAVQSLEGPVMVLAGPGTGKTQVTAMRIANILRSTDTPPSAILALTFTDSGVQAMRKRLVELIGTMGYYVQIYTFHSFCADVIRAHPEKFVMTPDPQPLSDLERFQIIQEILDTHPFESLKPINAPYYYVRAIISSIQTLKREGVEPPMFKVLVDKQKTAFEELLVASQNPKNKITKAAIENAQKLYEKNQALLEIYYLYQKTVTDRGRFDFEDMINFVNQGLARDETLLLSYQEKCQYILVDEFQDTNSAQNKLVQLLASFWGENANIFVVGDPNQSIYRFQGANLENILSFIHTYPKVKVLALIDNYRSTQKILDAAAQVIANNTDQNTEILNKIAFKLKSHSDGADLNLGVMQLPSDLVEDFFVAQNIKKLLDTGVKPQEIAVIFRKNSDALTLNQMLVRFNIPVLIQGGNNILTDHHVRQLLNLLRVIQTVKINQEGVDLFNVLSLPFFDFDAVDLLKVARFASKNKIGMIEVLKSDSFLQESDVQDPAIYKNFLVKLSNWEKMFAQTTISEAIETVVMQSGLLRFLESRPDSIEKLNRLRGLLVLADGWYHTNPDMDLSQFLSNIEVMESNGINVDEPDLGAGQEAVVLTTAHKAKGMEWNYVFLYRCVDGVWGNVTNRELIKLPEGILQYQKIDTDKKLEQNEDERRLFYVALTRAKKQITISYADQYAANSKNTVPSMFISEIPNELITQLEPTTYIKETKEILADLFKPTPVNRGNNEEVFLHGLINEGFSLSPTAYTTFLECPYKYKLQNLVRIPQASNPTLIFGSAVHKVLELFYRVLQQEGTPMPLEAMLASFRTYLKTQPLPNNELVVRLKQGEKILTAYYHFHEGKFKKPFALEKWFGGQYNPVFLDGISLVGKMDRIEYIDETQQTVRIVDYKTGKPKSLGQINGETQDSNGGYRKQLIFYKLVTELDPNFPYVVEEVMLDFVEAPYLEKRFVQHTLSISETEIEELKSGIKKTVEEIKALHFSKTGDYKICSNCPFKDHCWPEGTPTIKPEQLELL